MPIQALTSSPSNIQARENILNLGAVVAGELI